jgi:hypothetical protein
MNSYLFLGIDARDWWGGLFLGVGKRGCCFSGELHFYRLLTCNGRLSEFW